MKNVDPKIIGAVCIVAIVLALFFIFRQTGVTTDRTPPPIQTGGGPAAPVADPGKPPPTPQLTLPPIGGSNRGGAPPINSGGMTLPGTPPGGGR